MRRLTICLALLLSATISLPAQSLGLEDAVRIACDSAVSARISENLLLLSRWKYEEFLATRRTKLSFELNPGYQKFTNEPDLHYYKLRNYNMLNTYGGLQLEQAALGIGGSFYANSSALWTEYFGPDAAPRVFSMMPFGVGYYNELIGYNPYKWDKKINEHHLATQEKAYLYELASIANEAEKYFIDCLVASFNYEICAKNCEVSNTALEIGREKFAIASISKNELFALELNKLNADNVIFDARNALVETRAKLFSYLQIEDQGQELIMPEIPQYRMILLEDAVNSAMENNPDFRNAREDVIKAEKNVEKARIQNAFMQTAIDLNLGLQSNSNVISRAYSNQKAFVVGGITLSIPIFDGGLAKSRKKVAEFNLRTAESQAEEQTRALELQVKTLLNDFNTQQDLLMRTSEAIQLADESFEMASELYGNGEIDINTFILTLQRKDESYKNYLSSLKAYWDSWYALNKLCLFSAE